jgi:hypothetical protein
VVKTHSRLRAAFFRLGYGFCALQATIALASGHVDLSRCARLSTDERSELLARSELLLLNVPAAQRPESVVLECTDSTSRWQGTDPGWNSLLIDEGAGLVEGALDALHAQLSSRRGPSNASARPEANDAPTENAPRSPGRSNVDGAPEVAAPVFDIDGSQAPTARRVAARGSIGGIGLGVTTERWADFGRFAVGPRLDIGVGRGQFALRLYESTLLSHVAATSVSSDYRLLLFDLGGSANWGAPFVSGAPLGAHAGLAFDWFSAGGEPNAPRVATRASPVVRLGVAAAAPLEGVSLWLGLDGAYRFANTTLRAPIARGLPAATISASLGGLVLAN